MPALPINKTTPLQYVLSVSARAVIGAVIGIPGASAGAQTRKHTGRRPLLPAALRYCLWKPLQACNNAIAVFQVGWQCTQLFGEVPTKTALRGQRRAVSESCAGKDTGAAVLPGRLL